MLRRHLLMVEPDPVFSALLKVWLEDRTWKVTHHTSGRRALSAVAALVPSVAMISLDTQDINGFELIDQLWRDAPSVPVVACAPHTAVGAWDRKTLDALHLRAAIVRPIRFGDLERTLRKATGSPLAVDFEADTVRLDDSR